MTIEFIADPTITGYSAYRQEVNGIIATTGDNLDHLKVMALEAYNLYCESRQLPTVAIDAISFAL